MAHSLFEPTPPPLHEQIWRRVQDIKTSMSQQVAGNRPIDHTEPALLQQARQLDARGRYQLLQAVLTAKPIAPRNPERR